MWKEWKTEWIKVKYRGIGWMLLAFLALIVLWTLWVMGDIPKEQAADGFRMMFFQIPMMDTILMPAMIAMLASRLCDAEVKSSTMKLLCTMEEKGRLFDMKVLTGAFYLALFVAAETVFIFIQSKISSFTSPLDPAQLLYFIAQVYIVSLAILIFQVVLSFFFENQILPLAAGIFGSFVGLFSWFFRDGILKKCFLWGYYSELCFIRNVWDPDTRIVTYYDAPFDVLSFCLLLGLLAVGYGTGKVLFLRKEI